MCTSRFPWAGLAAAAARVDLWGVIATLGGVAAAASATPAAWAVAGLPFDLLKLLRVPESDPRALVPTDAEWPGALIGQPFAPVLLTTEGDRSLLTRPAVAVVGARACTPYGLEQARDLARAVAVAGGVVVSGLARGIDREAHLAAPGATVAVLGQGLDSPMPHWQATLRARVLSDGGLVVSEFPPGLPADVWTFPVRNRIVAGLARAVVVVEAGHRSGAKGTAGHALRLGKEVLAVPGPLGAPASAGCLDLIEDGATMVRGRDTVLQAASLARSGAPPPGRDPSDQTDAVAAALGVGNTAEGVMATTGMPFGEVTAALVGLVLQGRAQRVAGNRFVPSGRP